ncbi:hypothetical protein TSUD_86160 [Trifolium subterraneum]|uniref:Uncharacterized protein n=1 Tax=Trifolium subterraneum TaxID=3900 RepID=A0A2Z6P2B8_TRISU|nr:hypothetical protein TSUD_86160 [Trifolium subterraneum]
MGCCASSNKALTSSVATIQLPKSSQTNGTNNLQVEEEKVKEVLLETPKLNPKNTTKLEPPKPHRNIKAYDKVNQKKQTLSINKGHDSSETCRLRKTMPTVPIASREKTGKRVNGSPIKLLKNCSFPGNIDDRRVTTVVHGSRNFGSARFVQCREQVGQKMVNEGIHRRRDSLGENSFRRSRLPATRADTVAARSVMGRSQSARKTNRAPVARSRTMLPEKGRRQTEIPAMDSKRFSVNESLENPLVIVVVVVWWRHHLATVDRVSL